jgi:hypothetical protein
MKRFSKPTLAVMLALILLISARSLFADPLSDVADVLNRIFDLLQKIDQAIPNVLASRYGAIWTPWLTRPPTQDISGKNTVWRDVLANTSEDYLGAIKEGEQLLDIDPTGSLASPEVLDQIQRQIARIYRTDALDAHTLHNVVKVPLHAEENDAKIEALEQDVLSPSPQLKHVLAQLQLANAAHVQSLHIGQDTNKLLTAVSQQLLLESQGRREGEVRTINRHLLYVQRGLPLQQQLSQGTSSRAAQFRLP